MALIFEELDKNKHNVRKFRCGKSVMDEYIRQFAHKNAKLGISRTWVVVEDTLSRVADEKLNIVGYFTLSVQSVETVALENNQLPQYPTPVTLLARLAVERSFQGKGVGKRLLLAALNKALEVNDNGLPTYAVILDVLDEDARKFYEGFQFFRPLKGKNSNQLFVPMEVIRDLIKSI